MTPRDKEQERIAISPHWISAAIKERPILFSGAMVRAILSGTKTQTRRIAKLRDTSETYSVHDDDGWPCSADECGDWHRDRCPYGNIGDRLWVRESFNADFKPLLYRASATSDTYGGEQIRWKPSIHMPRKLSRIRLEITGVRVERLHDISEADAIAEGIEQIRSGLYAVHGCNERTQTGNAVKAYMYLWESINGRRPKLPQNTSSKRYARVKRWLAKHPDSSWAANPWVWVVEFKVAT